MTTVLECIVVFVVSMTVVAVVGAIAYWVALPLEQAAKGRQQPTQFTIADVLCLFLLAHLPSIPIYCCLPGAPREEMAGLYVLGWIVVGVVWWIGVGMLSRAGVRQSRQRAVFLLGIFPLLLTALLAQLMVPVLCFMSCYFTAIVSQVGLGLLFYGLGLSVRRLLRASRESQETAD